MRSLGITLELKTILNNFIMKDLTTVERIHLWYYDSFKNSDKVYNIELQHNPITDKYSVFFEYGRRGKGLRPGFKIEDVSKSIAYNTMLNLQYAKEKKGYDLVSHDRNMQTINPAPYIKLAGRLNKSGILTDNEKTKIVSFLTSQDSETIVLAIDILSARKSKNAA
ncbi:MAG: WGR domain-containing protein [Candidatus Kariarchaeaceae archaeon]